MDTKAVVEVAKEEPQQVSTDTDKPCEKAAEESKTPIEFDDSSSTAGEQGVKRSLLDVGDTMEESEEDSKKKKRRDSDATPGRQLTSKNASGPDKSTKPTPLKAGIGGPNTKVTSNVTNTDRNSPVLVKPTETEDDNEEMPLAKCLSGINEGGPKVPPLKIVIPQQSTTLEQEQGARNGKNGKTHQALPYVVASSNSNDSVSDKEVSTNPSPTDCGGGIKGADDKKDANLTAEERSHPRVLRSSHRSGGSSSSSSSGSQPATGTVMNTSGGNNSGSNASSPQPGSSNSVGDRNSNNSSPHQTNSQGQSPSPEIVAPIPIDEMPVVNVAKPSNTCASPPAVEVKAEPGEVPTHPPPPTLASTPSVELHPRKRKLKQSKELVTPVVAELPEVAAVVPDVHPHDQPITNCYQLFLDIRKQIERRRKGLFPVQPKPPQGFKDYLMNRCTYVLAGNASSRLSIPVVTPPQSLQGSMKDLFTEQEKERYRLRMQHVIEKEKLVLSVEQEILRVHGRAARALANQTRPFSVCTILKDEEVYNVITPEQEEKDRNARSRYNGRLFLSWLQDVDDKWEKIKESMCLRHHNEAESLHAVQKMDWEWKMKELGICEFKAKPVIEDVHVPMVHVSDDFDLLPA